MVADSRPNLLVYASNDGGPERLVETLATNVRRRVTDRPVGVLDGTPTLDGEGIL